MVDKQQDTAVVGLGHSLELAATQLRDRLDQREVVALREAQLELGAQAWVLEVPDKSEALMAMAHCIIECKHFNICKSFMKM